MKINKTKDKTQNYNHEEFIYEDDKTIGNELLKRKILIKVIIFFAITIFSLLPLIFASSIENLLNYNYFYSSVLTPSNFKIHFLDVGQGDCTIIELTDGKTLMIDCGPKESFNKVNNYFKFAKIPKTIDYFILTHTDKDHVGNAEKIIENYEVKNIYLPKVYSNYEASNNLITNKNYKIFNNIDWNNLCYKIRLKLPKESINYLEEIVTITNPDINKNEKPSYDVIMFPPPEEYYEDDNKYSPFIWLKIGLHQVLFTGDADSKREEEFLKQVDKFTGSNNKINVNILKVGHHGSSTSSSKEFLQKINPAFAVISCGKNNTYGHPSNETINNLKENNSNIKIYRTDTQNSIMFLDTTINNKISFGFKYKYENLDSFYIKCWHLSVTIIVVSFVAIIMPIMFNRKVKVMFKNLRKSKKKYK